jgi:hypothetical protein
LVDPLRIFNVSLTKVMLPECGTISAALVHLEGINIKERLNNVFGCADVAA